MIYGEAARRCSLENRRDEASGAVNPLPNLVKGFVLHRVPGWTAALSRDEQGRFIK